MLEFPSLIYTLCFLTRPDQVLLLRRDKAPNLGLWNGVGGRIEDGETPLESCLREVREETGYRIQNANFSGLLTWEGFEISAGGLYLFTAPAPAGQHSECSEGLLEWKPRPWAETDPQVVSNLHYVLPHILDGASPQLYHFVYRDQLILRHTHSPLSPDSITNLLATRFKAHN